MFELYEDNAGGLLMYAIDTFTGYVYWGEHYPADEADGRAWYRVDVYSYDGDYLDADDAFEDVMDSCEADGDVLHIDVCGGEVHVEIYEQLLRLRGFIIEGD